MVPLIALTNSIMPIWPMVLLVWLASEGKAGPVMPMPKPRQMKSK